MKNCPFVFRRKPLACFYFFCYNFNKSTDKGNTMSHTDIGIFELFLPPLVEEPEVFTLWRVRMKYKDTGVEETINFQSVNVFKFVADDVDIILWEHVRNDGEVLSEGTSLASMEKYEAAYIKQNEV